MRKSRLLLLAAGCLAIADVTSAQTIVGQDRDRPELSRNMLVTVGPKGIEARRPFGKFQRVDPFLPWIPGWPFLLPQAQQGGLERPPPNHENSEKVLRP